MRAPLEGFTDATSNCGFWAACGAATSMRGDTRAAAAKHASDTEHTPAGHGALGCRVLCRRALPDRYG
jgi:hypothetical protein